MGFFIYSCNMNWFKKTFGKKVGAINKVTEPQKREEYVPKETYEYKGISFKLGDRVICRSNECDPLLVGHIVEFWDNEGKWSNCIPYVKDEKGGEIWGVMGIVKPYTKELLSELDGLKPLEQWNHLIPKEYRYSKDTIKRKEEQYKNRKNNV